MAIIKCKMCGGDLILTEGQSVAECEYCGSRQTVPATDNEKKLNLFASANKLRAGCEFDRAMGVYDSIRAEFPDEAEAYWGLVLCKYGIEYVDDPATGKKIPTCHRSSFDSILEDTDFEQTLENADAVARRVYLEEGRHLEQIRKDILAVSSREKPYDVFICYKETDENGDRTLDSQLAQQIYMALTDRGYRVFFARVTLKGALGAAYEPIIFAALNSAKVMLAVGTSYDHFNAVWVKNEWSRYLKLCAKTKDKYLIPCFRGIDAYDMPKEFRPLQGVDLGQMGAVQDIVLNMEKYIPLKKNNTTVIQETVVVGGSGENKIASLLDRGNMALEDGDWAKADSFFEDVLNNDSKNAQAYLGKTLAQERCRTIDAFVRKRKDVSQNVRGQKLSIEPSHTHVDEMVKKFSLPGYVEQGEIRNLYTYDLSYHSDVAERKQQYKAEETYWAGHKLLSRAEKFAEGAVAENLANEKKALFAVLSDRVKKAEAAENAAKKNLQQRYEAHLKQADEKADALYQAGLARRESHYQELLHTAKTSVKVEKLKETAGKFDQLGDYQDSKNLAEHCRKRAKEEQAKLDAEAERQRALKARQEKARKAKNKKIAVVFAVVAIVVIIAATVVTKVIIPNNKYNNAVALMEKGQYTEAIEAFEALDGYKDSADKIGIAQKWIAYEDAEALLAEGKKSEAIAAFENLEDFEDSAERVQKIREESYAMAEQMLSEGDLVHAAMNFGVAGDYRDARQRSLDLWKAITPAATVSLDILGTIAVKADGTVVATGENEYGQFDVSDWNNILSVASAYSSSIGLRTDGTVLVAGIESEASQWTDIVAIAANSSRVVGLRTDGTVITTSHSKYGEGSAATWTDIVAISAEDTIVAGLKADGSVVAMFDGYGEFEIPAPEQWSEVVEIDTGSSHIVALLGDGTVIAEGHDNNEGQCNVSEWENIVSVSAGSQHTVGLKADGTVVAVGHNSYGQCEVFEWTDIVEVFAGPYYTVGLKADGTLVAVGSDKDGKMDVFAWRDLMIPQERAESLMNQKRTVYAKAEALLTEKKYEDAAELFSGLGYYEDAAERAMDAYELAKAAAYANAQAGDILVFGTYNDKDLRWRVLAREGNSLLMITESCVTERHFQSNQNDPKYYKDSPIRDYLNRTFYKNAFTEEQKALILEKNLPTTGGDVTDKVFLLSDQEANTYFSSDEDRVSKDGEAWYLRTVNQVKLDVLNVYEPIAMMVTYSGQVYQNDWTVDYARGIRPAMWIDVSSYVAQLDQ